MGTIVLTLALMLLAIAGLGIGVMFGRQPIKGSCGGLNCGECACGRGKER